MINSSEKSSELIFFVNGKKIVEKNPCPKSFLVTYLRETLNLRGTKISCGEGGCGSCTVVVSTFDWRQSSIKHEARYACLTPICLLHGSSVTTVEALGSTRTRLHKLQSALSRGHGVQCGFCTPGMLMSMFALLRNNSEPSQFDIETALRGNLCRCTGYRPIIESFNKCAKELTFNCSLGENCCQNIERTENDVSLHNNNHIEIESDRSGQDLIFPNELQLNDEFEKQNLMFQSKDMTWYSPTCKDEFIKLKKFHPKANIVAGGNVVSYRLKNLQSNCHEITISLSRISEFNEIMLNKEGIILHPNVTISDLESTLKKLSMTSDSKPHLIDALLDMCHRIASVQIRNTSTVCGGLAQGMLGSDLNVLLVVADCKVTLISSHGHERMLDVDIEFLKNKSHWTNDFIYKLFIPFHNEKTFFGFYKLSPRHDLSRAMLNSGFAIEFDEKVENLVKMASFVFGGNVCQPIVMSRLQTHVMAKCWKIELLPSCLETIEKDFEILKSQGILVGSNDQLSFILFSMQGLFFKFFVKILIKLSTIFLDLPLPDIDLISCAEWEDNHKHDIHSGIQVYNESHLMLNIDDLGKPLPHQWASQSTTGEALFIDDYRHYKGELCLSLVISKKARANILNVDFSEALKSEGVIGHIDHSSVQGSNVVEHFHPRELFATSQVYYVGQLIGAILAQTHEQARYACSLVRVEYDEQTPIISIEDAIKANSFNTMTNGGVIRKGDTQKAFELCDDILENQINIGGQEHFYMETHCCRVIPLIEDGGELEVFAGTQYASGLQKCVAAAVNLPHNKINIRVKRMGGGFGGKELNSWLTVLPCAVAALKFNLPVRCMLTRREDMQMTGNRRPYMAKYKVGFTKIGKINAIDLKIFSNDGDTPDWTMLMEVTLLNCDGVYNIPNILASGNCCKTNLPPSTAMRGAGNPQAVIIVESIISDVAIYLGKPPHQIRELNMYHPCNLSIANCLIDRSLHRCYEDVKIQSDFYKIYEQVQLFNSKNKHIQRGICLLPIKFSPWFPPFMFKGAALVNVYRDGSVLLSHGGVECGQGLHTKMIQIASRVLGIPSSYIKISETSTSIVPNTESTGGSTGSDINGLAVKDACEQIVGRLRTLRESNPLSSWEDIVTLALKDKINLSAFGHWNCAFNEDYDWVTGRGQAHSYYTYGAVVTLVEVDCLTGNHVVLQVDIVMDAGNSLNPAIDVGQIEGAFIMGMGLCLLEEHRYSSDGTLDTVGPDKYHVPMIGDLPLKMNVTLLRDSGNDRAVYSSKGIGEPPLLLSTSVWLAIKDVVSSVKRSQSSSSSSSNVFEFNTPATPKNVLLALKHFK